jgi:LysM repeat protein
MISVLNRLQQLNGSNNMITDLNMNYRNFILLVILIAALLVSSSLFSQVETPVERSRITETIDGKEYYLHFVREGETLFSIARAYNTTVNDVFRENPASREGIRPGMILKIPVEKKTVHEQVITEQPSDDFFYHIVQKQETLYSISRKYGVTVQAIRKLNPETGEYLREGETLKIPRLKESISKFETPEKEMTVHSIVAGETLFSIARKYNVPTGVIINANPGISPESLTIGQTLLIPQPEPDPDENDKEKDKPEQFTEHIVAKGETLYSISRYYGVSIDSMKMHNVGLDFSLYIGQKLKIPVAHQASGFIVYTPDKAERLDRIAEKHRIEPEEITEINPEISRRAKKGQPVKIPVDFQEDMDEDFQDEEEVYDMPGAPCADPESDFERTVNVALMVPLFLEEVDSILMIDKRDYASLKNINSFRFLHFYSGFLMAVDSMKKQGLNINLFVYDVDNSDHKVNAVLNRSELSRMDLIIGPLYARSFSKASVFAKTFKIPIVNPLSTREEIIHHNPYVFKLKPSSDVQTDMLVEYILRHYTNSNVVIVRHNQYQFQSPASYVRNNLNSLRPDQSGVPNSQIIKLMSPRERKNILTENKVIDYEKVSRNLSDSTYFSNYVKEAIYVKDSTLGLKMSLSAARHNLVIAFSEDVVFSKEILSQLNKLNQTHDITLFGIPDWHAYTDLETSHLLNLNLHSFTGSLVNYQDENTRKWIEQFRQRFKGEPTEGNFAFDGFDTGWYFLNALSRFGKDFCKCLDHLSVPLIQTRFKFEHMNPNGYRNVYWNLGRFEDYQFKKVGLN